MTIKECIDIVDNIKPNQYSTKDKVGWLSFIDEIIINDVLKTHEGYDGRYDNFEGYSENKLSVVLIVPSPYDRLYTAYLKMKIDSENGETARYNNSAELFNTYMMEYRKYYNRTHMPLDTTSRGKMPAPKHAKLQLPDIVIENIKRDLYALLAEDFAKVTSQDKIYEVVTKYVSNNVLMLKGKPGETPVKGRDYNDGTDGIGIAKIKQTVTSPEDGGTNTILITMTDGSTYRFYVKNGEKGDKGDSPIVGVDYYTPKERLEFKNAILEDVSEILDEKENKIESPASYFKYTITNNTVTITGLTDEGKAATEINVPSIIDGLPVTTLAHDVFENDTNLISASIPVGVTKVGIRLFSGCINLKTVKLPTGLTSIPTNMFSNCKELVEVNIPDGVTSIGQSAFSQCLKLKSVLVVPEGVETLGQGCFNGCTSVTKVVLPKSLKTIGNNVFGGNYSLININLPDGLTTMGKVVFYDCYKLRELYIPDSVTSIGSGDYFGTTEGGLSDITIICNPGSYAETWAIEKGIPYEYAYPTKEDVVNKTTEITAESTDAQYPSAKAVYDAVEASGDFELVDSAELTENVMQLTPTINGQYKELYLRFTVPTSGNASGIKARWLVYTNNQWGTSISKCIYNQGNQFVIDYSSQWYTAMYIKVFGGFIRTEAWFETTQMADNAYARPQNSSTYSGYVAPSVPTAIGYIDALKLVFQSPSGTADEDLRYLPAGTTYEIWGVKA